MGCMKMGIEIDPILLNWIHPVPGFNCVLEFPRTVNNRVGNFSVLIWVYVYLASYLYSRISSTWLKTVSTRACGSYYI